MPRMLTLFLIFSFHLPCVCTCVCACVCARVSPFVCVYMIHTQHGIVWCVGWCARVAQHSRVIYICGEMLKIYDLSMSHASKSLRTYWFESYKCNVSKVGNRQIFFVSLFSLVYCSAPVCLSMLVCVCVCKRFPKGFFLFSVLRFWIGYCAGIRIQWPMWCWSSAQISVGSMNLAFLLLDWRCCRNTHNFSGTSSKRLYRRLWCR